MSRILLLGNAVASSSNYDDDDGNKNIRKATGLIRKKKTLWTFSRLFGRFLCRHRTLTDHVKLERNGNAIVVLL